MNSKVRCRGRWGWAALAAVVLVAVFLSGVTAGLYQTFPVPQLSHAKRALLLGMSSDPGAMFVNTDAIGIARLDDGLTGKADAVMIGDSITAGARWDELFPDIAVHNRGISGDTVSGVAARVQQVVAKKPERVFVMVGINDLVAGNPEDRILSRFDDTVVALSPHTRVYVQSVLPCGADRCDAAMNARIDRLNNGLAALAARRGADWLDFHNAFARDGRLRADLSDDGIHLNARGFQLWRSLLAPHMPQPKTQAQS